MSRDCSVALPHGATGLLLNPQFVIVVFPDQTHLLSFQDTSNACPKLCNDANSILKLLKLLYAGEMVLFMTRWPTCKIH